MLSVLPVLHLLATVQNVLQVEYREQRYNLNVVATQGILKLIPIL